MNALKHGFRSQAKIREYQRIRYVLRLAAQNIALLRLHIRARDAGLRIRYKRVRVGGRATYWDIGEHHLPLSPCGSRALLRQRSCRGPERKQLNRFCGHGAGEGWAAAPTYQDTASPNPGRFGPHALGLE